MPRPCPAPTMPFFSRPRHIAVVERRPVGDLPAIGFFRLPRRVPRKLLSVAYHSQMQVASVKQNNMSCTRKRVGAAHYKKDALLKCGTAVRIFPATMRTFTKDTALSEQGTGAAWHVLINERHGRGTAWEQHGRGMLCVNRPLHCPIFEPRPLRKHGWRRRIMLDESSTSRRADAIQIKNLSLNHTPFSSKSTTYPLQSVILRFTDVPKERGTREPHYNFPALNAMNHIQ
jgi:hypothetical protein